MYRCRNGCNRLATEFIAAELRVDGGPYDREIDRNALSTMGGSQHARPYSYNLPRPFQIEQ